MISSASKLADDNHWMRFALCLGKQAQGRTAENPAVGCVILDKNYQLVGTGVTAPDGRPHAETQALHMAGVAAKEGIAYVTLEPCAHVGKTPPCAEALVAAGIKRCVIAASDPDARVNGAGAARLRAAGIEVVEGVLRQQAYLQLSGFMTRIQQARPRVTMKIAMSEDGFIAAGAGQQTWLTGEMAKRWTYDLRSRNDVILTGSGTALIDNPLMTCRAPLKLSDSPKRVVLDRQLTLPLNSQFVQTAKDLPLLIVVSGAVSDSARVPYVEAGVEFMTGSVSNEMFELPALLANLAECGVNTLMVEAGARLNQSFIATQLVDEICVLHAPIRLGEGGLPAVAGAVGLETLLERDYIKAETKKLGPDRLERWHLK